MAQDTLSARISLDERLKKRRRFNHNQNRTSALFLFGQDQEKFSLLYHTIGNTELIQKFDLDNDIIQLLSEFANGEFIDCFKCDFTVHFMPSDISRLQAIECEKCHELLWGYWCSIHQKYTTIEKYDKGPLCCVCRKSMCYDLTLNCSKRLSWQCKNIVCAVCAGDHGACDKCEIRIKND